MMKERCLHRRLEEAWHGCRFLCILDQSDSNRDNLQRAGLQVAGTLLTHVTCYLNFNQLQSPL